MKKYGMKWRVLAGIIGMLLAVLPALADGPALEEKSLEIGNSRVCYPAAAGMADEALQQEINTQLIADLNVEGYLDRMTQLISAESMQVRADWNGAILGDILSCVMSAEGALENVRNTHRWTWSNIDLRDGHEIGMDELFTDMETARDALEEYLDFQVAPDLSAHLGNSDVTPLPEGFRLEAAGLTLLYPVEQLSTLKDRAGDIRIGWNEIRDVLNLEEDSILQRIGAAEMITLTAESADKIRAMAESGQLPDIPVTVGDGLKALTDRYHMLIDPDVWEGGRLFSLEGGCFRNVFLMTDFLSEAWDDSVVLGIRMDRGCAGGLCIGETRQEDWREVLGEPDATTELDDERARAYRMKPGTCDYYRFGAYQLRLYADTENVLVSIVLTE